MRTLVCLLLLASVAACRTTAPTASSGAQSTPPAAPAQPAAPPAPAPAKAEAPRPLTPEEESSARDVIANNCLGCHTVEMLEQQRLTAKQWDAVIKKMQGWGAPLEPEHVELMVRYATARHGVGSPAYELKPVDAAEAAAAIAPQPDGPYARGSVKEGRTLYGAQCANCHGENGRGAAMGVNLVDRPYLHRAQEFAELVRNGRGRMPQFAANDAQVAALLAYLRTLKP